MIEGMDLVLIRAPPFLLRLWLCLELETRRGGKRQRLKPLTPAVWY